MRQNFSTSAGYTAMNPPAPDIPTIDGHLYMNKLNGWEKECEKVAESFHKYGMLKLRDPRVNETHNDNYIDLVERYFDFVSKKHYAGEKLRDSRPDLFYQTGVTPEGVEKARDH